MFMDSCITQLKAQGHARTCYDSKEEEEGIAESQCCCYFDTEHCNRPFEWAVKRSIVSFLPSRVHIRHVASSSNHHLKRETGISFAEQPVPAPHLAHSKGCAALRIVLVTVPRVSRSCEHKAAVFLENASSQATGEGTPIQNYENEALCSEISINLVY
jgi:hypothetical protein